MSWSPPSGLLSAPLPFQWDGLVESLMASASPNEGSLLTSVSLTFQQHSTQLSTPAFSEAFFLDFSDLHSPGLWHSLLLLPQTPLVVLPPLLDFKTWTCLRERCWGVPFPPAVFFLGKAIEGISFKCQLHSNDQVDLNFFLWAPDSKYLPIWHFHNFSTPPKHVLLLVFFVAKMDTTILLGA